MGTELVQIVEALQSGDSPDIEEALLKLQYLSTRAPLIFHLVAKQLLSKDIDVVVAGLGVIEQVGPLSLPFLPALELLLLDREVDIVYATLAAIGALGEAGAVCESGVFKVLKTWGHWGEDAWILPDRAAETLARTTFCRPATLHLLIRSMKQIAAENGSGFELDPYLQALLAYRGPVRKPERQQFRTLGSNLSTIREAQEQLAAAEVIFTAASMSKQRQAASA